MASPTDDAFGRAVKRLTGSSTLSFVVYPIVVVAAELILGGGRLHFNPWWLILMAWGYAQYRLCGLYRIRYGGGGPGMDTPPDRLVTTGPFAYSRNPMYLGHVIFLAGLALALHSWLAAALAVLTIFRFTARVRRDESRLVERFGAPYVAYLSKVPRWLLW